jgi:hypothetical protein
LGGLHENALSWKQGAIAMKVTPAGSGKREAGSWQLETGNWKLETGNWKLETEM